MKIDASILIPVYNGSRYLENCFNSLANSDEILKNNIEIIFIDDASTDKSYEKLANLIKSKNSRKYYLIRNKENKGISYSLNKGLDFSNGEYIFRLDIDDLWVEGRFQKSIDIMQKLYNINKKYVLIGTSMIGISGRQYNSPLYVQNVSQLIFSSCVFHPSWCIKSEIAKKYTYEMDSPFDDYYFILRILLDNYLIYNIPENLVIYNDLRNKNRITVKTANERNVNALILKFLIFSYLIDSLLLKNDIVNKKILLKKIKKIIYSKNVFKSNFIISRFAWLINTMIYKFYILFLNKLNQNWKREIKL